MNARKHSPMRAPLVRLIAAALITAVPLATQAASATTAHDAHIPFALMGGIRDWADDGRAGIYVQASDRRWYHATFYGPCIDLPFSVGIRFVPDVNGALDRFSAVRVGRDTCAFRSFSTSEAPPHQGAAKPADPSRT